MKYEKVRYESPNREGEVWRKRVYFDDEFDGLTLVADERVASAGPDARVLQATTLELTAAEVEWLYQELGRLREKLNDRQAWEDEELARELREKGLLT